MNKKSDRLFLVAAGALFGLFLLNIFLGKAALAFNMEPILNIGDVGEFLLLLTAVIFFIIVVLHREKLESNLNSKSAIDAEKDAS